jgi:hypothetical protein
MSSKNTETSLPLGFTTLQSSKLIVPVAVAQRIKLESAGASKVWESLQCGQNPDGSGNFDEPLVFDLKPTVPYQSNDASDESQTPPRKVELNLNAAQLRRLDQVITQFCKYANKQKYSSGKIELEREDRTPILLLERDGNIGALSLPIEVDQEEKRRFGGAFSSSRGRPHDEHNALDLYLIACRKIPAFCKASSRSTQPKKKPKTRPLPPAPIPYSGKEPPLRFDPPLLQKSEILPSQLINCLTLGGSGGGKTFSFLQPVLHAMIDYKVDEMAASILVVDPKSELLASVEKKLAQRGELERLVVIGQTGPLAYFHQRHDLSLEDRFAKAKQFVSANTPDDNGRWQVMADRFILGFLRDAEAFQEIVGVGLLQSIVYLVTDQTHYLHRNQWVALRKMLNIGMEGGEQLRLLSDLYDTLTLGIGLKDLERPYARYINLKDSDQIFYNSRSALLIADLLGSKDIEGLLDMSISPVQQQSEICDVADLIEHGAVIVFQPRKKATHDLVGAALKSLFFQSAFERKEMLRPLGYFCDEAQRFLTTDEETGEHSVFDTARAYRLTACIASQSMAALQTAVGAGPKALAALESIIVNTPTKVCFRTTDIGSLQLMKRFIPADPRGSSHVLHARPPSSLRVGECYFSLDDQWGRYRYRLGDVSPDTRDTSEIVTKGAQP